MQNKHFLCQIHIICKKQDQLQGDMFSAKKSIGTKERVQKEKTAGKLQHKNIIETMQTGQNNTK